MNNKAGNEIKYRGNTWYLFTHLVKTDIQQRYQGSILGVFWSVLVPLIMLAIYTFIFSEIFKARWSMDTGNKFEFAMMLFCGLSLYNMFSDVMGRSVSLIASHQNYVKKVLFPLEILPLVITFSALFNCIVSFLILIIVNAVLSGHLYITVLEVPLVLVSHIIFCAGMAYIFSAISVYLRDMVNFISVIITICMYVSPVFFPLSAVPEKVRRIMMFNPMTYMIENMRNAIIYGTGLNLYYYVFSLAMSILIFFVGWWIFKRARPGFADLL